MQRDPVGFQSGQHVGRDVLVVEGDDVTGGGEPAYGIEVGVVTHWSRRDDQGRRRVDRFGENAQLHAERDRRGLEHPR